jgi:hypothetical protein
MPWSTSRHQAVMELRELDWRVPRLTGPECESEEVHPSSDDPGPGLEAFDCPDYGHSWTETTG